MGQEGESFSRFYHFDKPAFVLSQAKENLFTKVPSSVQAEDWDSKRAQKRIMVMTTGARWKDMDEK